MVNAINEVAPSVVPQPQTVILATGDPGFFGIASSITKRVNKDTVEIIPGVSTMQEAFARIKMPWDNAKFLSFHGRVMAMEGLMCEISAYSRIGIFTDHRNTPPTIAKALLEMGLSGYHAYVCEELGTEDERITEATLNEISKRSFSALNVLILIREHNPVEDIEHSPYGVFGMPDSEFVHRDGMITKEEVRSVVLGKLCLKEDSIVWDIGAGSGAVSIEASRIAKRGTIYALEKDEVSLKRIEENRKTFKANNLVVIAGEAPEPFDNIPMPDAVFIGGSGGRLKEIILYLAKNIKKGGRIVAAFTVMDNLMDTFEILKGEGMTPQIVQVSVSRSRPLSGKLSLKALNPVFIVSCRKGR